MPYISQKGFLRTNVFVPTPELVTTFLKMSPMGLRCRISTETGGKNKRVPCFVCPMF